MHMTNQNFFVLEASETDDSPLHGTGIGWPDTDWERLTLRLAGIHTWMPHHSERGGDRRRDGGREGGKSELIYTNMALPSPFRQVATAFQPISHPKIHY